MYYVILCVDYDVLNLHIGHVQSEITSSLSVSHAAVPSAWLDCMQLYLVYRVQMLGAYPLRHLHDEPLYVHME